MKHVFIIAAMALSGAAVGALAQAPPPPAAQAASVRDLQELQYDLANLDESLRNLSPSDPRYQDLQQRVDWLRRDADRLELQMRAQPPNPDTGEISASQADVRRLRDDARALQRDLARSDEHWEQAATLPAGTELEVELDRPVSSATARREERVSASVARPVVVDGRVVIPAGTRVDGWVRQAEPASPPLHGGRLDLAFDRLVLDGGRSMPLESRVVSVGQGAINRKSAGIGAVLGGVLGAVIGGGKGAVVGAIVGGAGGIAAGGGREVRLPAGADLTLRLDRPLQTAEWTGPR